MFIDSHAHLQFADFDNDREEVIARAFDKGVKYILNIGTDLETSRQSLEIAKKYNNIFTAVGVHPHNSESFDDDVKKSLLEMLRDEKVVAVGETGLDYYRDYSPPEVQKRVFAEQLLIAGEANLPVIIHTRNAWEDIEDVIDSTVNRDVKGIFHCYSGGLETALRLIKKGFLISFGGSITFKNYKHVEMLDEIPVEKMLIETDCPFLAPEPFRGKRNQPGYVPLIAQKLADIKGLSIDDIGRITAFNVNRMFGIAPETEEVKKVYKIRDSLYINPTMRCNANCVFCARLTYPFVKGHNLGLSLEDEPTPEEAIALIGDPNQYREVVFCGYGEPVLRLDFIKEVARWLKSKGATVRLNTDGHGNLIYGRNIVPELTGIIDKVSVSLNTYNPKQYQKIMRTEFGEKSFNGALDFIRKCVAAGIETDITIVDIPSVDVDECRKLAGELGAKFRIRKYNEVG